MPELSFLPEHRPRPRSAEVERLIEQANRVPIVDVLNELGCDIPAGVPNSWKGHCPYDAEHRDGGVDPAMRVYVHTNTAFCFAGHGAMTPARLIMRAKRLDVRTACRQLLEGHPIAETEARDARLDVEARLQAALHELLSATPQYARLNLHPRVMNAVDQALFELDKVELGGDGAGVWLRGWSRRIQEVMLGVSEDETTPPVV